MFPHNHTLFLLPLSKPWESLLIYSISSQTLAVRKSSPCLSGRLTLFSSYPVLSCLGAFDLTTFFSHQCLFRYLHQLKARLCSGRISNHMFCFQRTHSLSPYSSLNVSPSKLGLWRRRLGHKGWSFMDVHCAF